MINSKEYLAVIESKKPTVAGLVKEYYSRIEKDLEVGISPNIPVSKHGDEYSLLSTVIIELDKLLLPHGYKIGYQTKDGWYSVYSSHASMYCYLPVSVIDNPLKY